MSLSSINRSNFNTFCHIMPYSAPVCEGMHYHKTGVPWQTNNILIFPIFPLFSGFSSLFTFLYQQPYVKNEKPAIAFNESILGYPLPDSHFEIAVFETYSSSASSSCVRFLLFLSSCNFSWNSKWSPLIMYASFFHEITASVVVISIKRLLHIR